MSIENCPAQNGDGVGKSLSLTYSAEDIRKLEKRLGELRDQGILIGGNGPREILSPVARVPGGLERFLAERE